MKDEHRPFYNNNVSYLANRTTKPEEPVASVAVQDYHTESFTGTIVAAQRWVASPQLRYAQGKPDPTHPLVPHSARLQQLWFNYDGNETEWRDVPIAIIDDVPMSQPG